MVTGHLLIREAHRCPRSHEGEHRSVRWTQKNSWIKSTRRRHKKAPRSVYFNAHRTHAKRAHVIAYYRPVFGAFLCDLRSKSHILIVCPGALHLRRYFIRLLSRNLAILIGKAANLKSRCFEVRQTCPFIGVQQQHEKEQESIKQHL